MVAVAGVAVVFVDDVVVAAVDDVEFNDPSVWDMLLQTKEGGGNGMLKATGVKSAPRAIETV